MRSARPPRQIFWPNSTRFSWPAVAGSLSGCCDRYRATFCMSCAVRGWAMAVMGVGLPPGPMRSGSFSPSLTLNSVSCLTRYSCGWAARFGLAGMVLLPAAP
ncbi:Uncharacterised protein [Bordetella pertussis]|nr:Uncharacterised protein [Bordetella pertussis]